MPSYDNKVLTGDQLVYFSGLIKTALAEKASTSAVSAKQDALVFNTAYNASTNKVATMSDLAGKQDALTIGGSGNTYNASTNPVATLGDIPDGVSGYLTDNPINAAEVIYDDSDENNVIWLADKIAAIDSDISDYITGGISAESIIVGENAETGDPINLADELGNFIRSDDLSLTADDIYYDTDGEGNERSVADILNDVEVADINADRIYTGSVDSQTNLPIMLDTALSDINTAISGKQDALVFNTAYNASSNKVATMSDITTALGGISSFSFEIVNSLPSQDISTSKIYLVAKQTSGTNQVYTEYAYVNNGWEIIGDTQMTIDTLTNQEVATIWSAASAT